MTKDKLAENLLSALDNMDGEMTRKEIVLAVFDILEPQNYGQFANWGQLEDKSTPKKCWQ